MNKKQSDWAWPGGGQSNSSGGAWLANHPPHDADPGYIHKIGSQAIYLDYMYAHIFKQMFPAYCIV